MDTQPLEHDGGRDERAAVGHVDRHGLALELRHAVDRLRGEHVHFFVVELGDEGELLLDVVGVALLLEVIERIRSHDAEVDALEEQDIGDALHRTAADDRQHPQIVAVVERGGEIGAELHVGTGDRAAHDGDGVRVQAIRRLLRAVAVFEDRLQPFAHRRRIDLRFGPRRRYESEQGHCGGKNPPRVARHRLRLRLAPEQLSDFDSPTNRAAAVRLPSPIPWLSRTTCAPWRYSHLRLIPARSAAPAR